MAQKLRAKVESGDYASESKVIRVELRALQARDRALDRWLREDVAEAYVAVKADPSCLLSSDDLKVSIAGIFYGGQDYETILADDDAC